MAKMITMPVCPANPAEEETGEFLKIHLELQTGDPENMEVLKRYGNAQNGISRDILVSADMPLYNLHFAIQRAFGWENSHLHSFEYPLEWLSAMTGGMLEGLLMLSGVYFRFPGDVECFDEEDDYPDLSASVATWLRRKYTGPYKPVFEEEHFLHAQYAARVFAENNPVVSCVDRNAEPQNEAWTGQTSRLRWKEVPLEEATLQESVNVFDGAYGELLERLPIGGVLAIPSEEDKMELLMLVILQAESVFRACIPEMQRKWAYDDDDQMSFYRETDPEVLPIADALLYSYDFGDSWEVRITCEERYRVFSWETPNLGGKPEEHLRAETVDGTPVEEDILEQIATVRRKKRPICLAADGLNVLDDVGGVDGFCDFLRALYDSDLGINRETKQEAREWAKSMGWTGKMKKPEQIL